MRVSLIRSVSRCNLAQHGLTIRFNSVSSLAQISFSDLSDSDSDENNPFLNQNNVFAYPFHHSRQVFDKYAVIETLDHVKGKPKTGLYFINHLKECGFTHDVLTYMAIIRFLCIWGMPRRLKWLFLEVINDKFGAFGFQVSDLVDELLNRVNVDGDNLFVPAVDGLVKAYISVRQFDEVFDVLLKIPGGFLPSVFTCNLLLNCLVEEGEVDMAIEIYKDLKMKGFSSNVYTYGIVVKGLCRKGCLKEAGDVLQEMKEAGGVAPNAFTFGSYIDGLCSTGYTDSAFELLKTLRELDSPVDVFAYASVIRGFIKELKLQDAENVLIDMKQVAIVPDVYCYGALVQAYCQKGNVLKALDLRHEMRAEGITTNCVILSSIMQGLCHLGMLPEAVDQFINAIESGVFLDEVSFNIAIDALCRLGKMHEAMILLEEMKHKKLKPDVMHYTTLIKGCCLHRDLWNALNIFGEMIKRGLKPDIVTFNVLVGGFSKCGLVKETLSLLDNMQALGLKPTSVTNNIVIDGLCKGQKVKEAGLFFDKLERKSFSNYVAMMNGYCETDNMREAYELFHRLSEQGKKEILVAKSSCCLKLFSWLCEEGEADNALILFKIILQSDKGPLKIMYSKLKSAYCRAGDMRMARWVFDTMVARGETPDVISYTIMLNGYLRMNNLKEAYDIFDDMINHGIQPDIITYTVLFDGESKVNWKDLTTKWSGGEERALSRFLIKMQEFVPDIICYTVLINHYFKAHNLQATICFFNEMIDRGIQPDKVTYTSFIRGYGSHGFIEKSVTLFHKMISEGVLPDSCTIVALEKLKAKRAINMTSK